MHTLGIPAHSSSTASRKLRALQLPQPPKPVMATVAPSVNRDQSPGSGGTETLDFTTFTTPSSSVVAMQLGGERVEEPLAVARAR